MRKIHEQEKLPTSKRTLSLEEFLEVYQDEK